MAKETKTVHGIKVTVDPTIFNDWDFSMDLAEMLEEVDEDSTEAAVKRIKTLNRVVDALFGEDQFSKIKAKLRDQNDGHLPVEAVSEFLNQAIVAFTPKNS